MTPAMDAIQRLFFNSGWHRWTRDLPSLLREGGFGIEACRNHMDDRVWWRLANDSFMQRAENYVLWMVGQNTSDRETGLMVLQCLKGALHESRLGALINVPRVVCIGSKPEDQLSDHETEAPLGNGEPDHQMSDGQREASVVSGEAEAPLVNGVQ